MAIDNVSSIDYVDNMMFFYVQFVERAQPDKIIKNVIINPRNCIPDSIDEDSIGTVRIVVNTNVYQSVQTEGLHIAVDREGYLSEDNLYIPSNKTATEPYKIKLFQNNLYNYVIYVRDNKNKSIYGAEVKAYTSENASGSPVFTGYTDINGRCYHSQSIGQTLYFQASKNGYNTNSTPVDVEPQTTVANAERYSGMITLYDASSSVNYYVVRVVNEAGEGQPNVKIGLYTTLQMTSQYVVSDTSNVVKGTAETVTGDKPSESDIFNDVRVILSTIKGIDVNNISRDDWYMTEYSMTTKEVIRLIESIELKYRFICSSRKNAMNDSQIVDDFVGKYGTVGDVIQYILDTGNFMTLKSAVYTTDDNGYLSIRITGTSDFSRVIYAKGLENKYVWNVRQGVVNTTTSDNTPGCTLSIVTGSEQTGTYYYSFQLTDAYTNNPVSGAEVIYSKNGVEQYRAESNSNGLVSYTSSSNTLSVKINKDGYSSITSSSVTGVKNTNQYQKYELTQINPIRVVYGYGDNVDKPASNIVVSIGYYDSQNNYTESGKYKTSSTGYIDGINAGYFASNSYSYYAVVLNYIPQNDSDKSALKKRLVLGGITIKLPEPMTTQDEIDEYVQFYDMSANSIKKNVNTGNQELNTKQVSNKVSYSGGDDYRINVLDPDSVTTYDIFQSKPVMMNNNQRSVIGSIDIGLKYDVNKLRLKVINRYSGYYNPIFKDILFYKNLFFNNDELPFSNVSFDYEYKDKYGKFGVINNMWFHKVNDDKDINILDTPTPYYPLTGQYALAYRDYNVFESNWDLEHYTKQLDIIHSKPCPNISSQKNGICMFGSKYLNVPNQIEIYGLTLGEDDSWKGEWNDDWITSPDACPGEVMYKEINNNSVEFYFFFTKRIHRFFYDKLKDEFEKYMNVDNGSYGKPGVEDDVKEYVAKNVLKLYRLEKVRIFVKRTKMGQHNSRIENDYTKYLEYDKTCGDPAIVDYFDKKGYVQYFKQHGFVEVNNVSLTKINRDDFDRKLIYNLRNGAKEEFGFSFILKKI